MCLQFKSNKADRKQHNLSIKNMHLLPSVKTGTGIPVLGLTHSKAQLLLPPISLYRIKPGGKLSLSNGCTTHFRVTFRRM